jgi:hypothetical protein
MIRIISDIDLHDSRLVANDERGIDHQMASVGSLCIVRATWFPPPERAFPEIPGKSPLIQIEKENSMQTVRATTRFESRDDRRCCFLDSLMRISVGLPAFYDEGELLCNWSTTFQWTPKK